MWFPAQHAARTLETGAQAGNKREKRGIEAERQKEREDRSIIQRGKKVDSKEMWGFGSPPP